MIIDKIKEVRLGARKARTEVGAIIASVTGVIIAELDRKQTHDDQACIKAVQSAIDNNQFAIDNGAQGEHLTTIQLENAMLRTFLPPELTTDELEEFVSEFVARTGANHMRFMGQLMSELRATGKVFDSAAVTKMFKNTLV